MKVIFAIILLFIGYNFASRVLSVPKSCPCPNVKALARGTDGKFYPSECALKCATMSGSGPSQMFNKGKCNLRWHDPQDGTPPIPKEWITTEHAFK